jgi:hypothetical protein
MRRLAWLVEWKFTTSWSAYFLLDKVFHMEIPIAWLSCNAYHIKKIIDGGPGWGVVKNILNCGDLIVILSFRNLTKLFENIR